MSVAAPFDEKELPHAVRQLGSIGIKRAAFSATIGNMLEFYDFVSYAFFAIQIGRTFFPTHNAYGSLMLSLATFGVGFVTRPIGAFVLGVYSDRVGRRPAMLFSFTLMGAAILVIALTPSYDAIGVAAPVIVIVARLVQGFALGGEVGPTTAYLLEIAPSARRALIISLQPLSQSMAGAAAGLVGFVLSETMTPAGLESMGWRIAFLIGAISLPFGLWMRRSLPETVGRVEAGAQDKTVSYATLVRRHVRVILLAMMILTNGTVTVYVTHYMTTYAQNTLHLAPSIGFATGFVSTSFQIVGVLLGGWLADRVGRKPIMIVPQLCVLVLTYPVFMWIVEAPGAWSLLAGFGLLSLITILPFTAFLVTFTEALPQQIRGGVFAIAYAVTIAIFGSTAQPMVTWLLHVSGNPLAPAWYLLLAATVGLLGMMLMPETSPAKADK